MARSSTICVRVQCQLLFALVCVCSIFSNINSSSSFYYYY